jgi:hypothetical protein
MHRADATDGMHFPGGCCRDKKKRMLMQHPFLSICLQPFSFTHEALGKL